MAKRKKIGAKRRHHKRRMGAAGSGGGVLEKIVGVVVGAVVGRVAYTSIALPQYMMGALQLVIGGGAAFFGGKIGFVQGAGFGLLANGAVVVGEETSVISGISGMIGGGSAAAMLPNRVTGFRDVPAVGAPFPKPAAVGKADAMQH